MMQILKDFPFSGHKLLCDSPTPERARFILNRLGDSKALIGIDNFADDLDGVNILIKAPNVQVLGCDEIYWLEIVSHRLPRDSMHFIDITDLSELDTQTIISHIPSDIRRGSSGNRARSEQHVPSIFEIVEYHTNYATLSMRYRSVLHTLETVTDCCSTGPEGTPDNGKPRTLRPASQSVFAPGCTAEQG